MSHWVLPLVALSELTGLSNQSIESDDHYFVTQDASSDVWPWRSYKTSPRTPPQMNISHYGGTLADGYIFMSPSNTKAADGTYELSGTGFIMTTTGDLVFASEERGYDFCDEWVAGMTDFRAQTYNGKSYVTYWNGCNTKSAHWGHRWGRVTFIDDEYTNFTVNPDLGVVTLDDAPRGQIDMHDHQMTEDNTMVATSYNTSMRDFSATGGSNETWVAESMFFEFDIQTGEILFQWAAMDHIPFDHTRWLLAANRGSQRVPWDYFHINSVQKVGRDYLVSARHYFSVFLVNGTDGSVIWTLDGEDGGSFGLISSRFRWQHHARAHNVTDRGMTVSLFNNHVNGAQNAATQSQALAFYLPLPASPHTPPLLTKRLQTDAEPIFSATQGSYQMDLGNGNGFVAYGKVPLLREYGPAPDGSDLRWQAWFGHDKAVMGYRAFKAPWRGTPRDWDPVVVFEASPQVQARCSGRVYVSWNGVTDVSHWAVFAGEESEELEFVGVAEKKGFETDFELQDRRCVQLGAVRDGMIIRASNVACLDDEPLQSEHVLPSKTDGGVDLEDMQTEKEAAESVSENVQSTVSHRESGIWISYQTIAAAAAATVVLAISFWISRFWRTRRTRKGYQALLHESPYPSPSRRLPSFALGGFAMGRGAGKFPRSRAIRPKQLDGLRFYGDSPLHPGFRQLSGSTLDDGEALFELAEDDDSFVIEKGVDEESEEDEVDVEEGEGVRTPFIRPTTPPGFS